MAKYPFKNCDSMANTQYENQYMFQMASHLGLETDFNEYLEVFDFQTLNSSSSDLDSHWALHTDASYLNV